MRLINHSFICRNAYEKARSTIVPIATVVTVLLVMVFCACASPDSVSDMSMYPISDRCRNYAVTHDGNVYFACGFFDIDSYGRTNRWSIDRMPIKSNKIEKVIYADIPAGDELFIWDGWIYYRDIEKGTIYRLHIDGKHSVEELKDSNTAGIIGIYEDTLYYLSPHMDEIIGLSFDGKQSKLLLEWGAFADFDDTSRSCFDLEQMYMIGEMIYFTVTDNDTLLSVSTITSDVSVVFEKDVKQFGDRSLSVICAADSGLYITLSPQNDTQSDNVFLFISTDDLGSVQTVSEDIGYALNNGICIHEGWIYFFSDMQAPDYSWTDREIKKMELIKRLRIADGYCDSICIDEIAISRDYFYPINDSIIYYSGFEGDLKHYCLTNGEQKTIW